VILTFVCLCSLQRLNLCLIKILDVNNPLVINQPGLCHTSTCDTTSEVCATAPLVIQSARSVPQLHWWYNEPSLCHSPTGDTVSQVCATHPLVIQPARSVPHFCYSFTGFSPWRPGFAPKAIHLQYVVDSDGGTVFCLIFSFGIIPQ
jgi:hypothetical protein